MAIELHIALLIPELGNFATILALSFTLIQAITPLWGYYKNNPYYFILSRRAVAGQFIFLIFAMLCLIISFILNDMTLLYVREHSHTLLPFIYRIGAAWGGHEGSLLLWCIILSGWTWGFSFFYDKRLPNTSVTKIIMVLGLINAGFILFLIVTSNPFKRDFPTTPIIGEDLTPLLQDPGLLFHPPMLYLGYVGFAIGFAFAICALIEGKISKIWVQALKPWIVLPWSFLGLGIVLGSWWAYRELGWGGWWAWDPVENASLLPWLSSTALIHCLMVVEKRNAFTGWAFLLAILTFALSLIGTFLVRSGVLVSVHAFANDPSRGIYLLSYLALIIGSALALYGARVKYFYHAPAFQIFSRETGLLISSIILISAMMTILIGTLYPILLDALNAGKISVGEPYFNMVFVPIMLPLLLLMGFIPHLHWGQDSFKKKWKKLRFSIIISLGFALLFPWVTGFPFHWLALAGLFLGIWIIVTTCHLLSTLLKTKKKMTLSHAAMITAHLGIAVIVLGITINKSYSEERQVKMSLREKITVAGYQFTFKNVYEAMGENYRRIIANFIVQSPQGHLKTLSAEQRIFSSHDQTMSKPGVLFNSVRDLYLALGAPLQNGSWSVRIYYKPCVRWIWFGGFMLLIGGFLSCLSYWKKYR
ncbi:MAG: ccmF 1 [Gammaproteobacteria bacterium]|jgi:cytochrome c-type biogenesis protein CcmF|nr:ccmF 1 [Gammaproteobacteria bacterium]